MLGRRGDRFLAAAMFLGVCLIAATAAQGSQSAALPDAKGLPPLLIAWLTVTVYFAGGAMILVAFAYFYRPGPWFRVCTMCGSGGHRLGHRLRPGGVAGKTDNSQSVPAAIPGGESR